MTKNFKPLAIPGRHRLSPWVALLTGVVLGVSAVNVSAQAPAAATGATSTLAAEDLVGLVGPIALYPDDLIAIILPASTNPLQIVQADRFLEKRKTEPKAPLDDRWDDAVKSLLNYPDIVKKMSNDLDWTSALGEEVVADQGAVLDAVQSFRRKAKAAGNLKSDGKQVVAAEQEIITIVPANPEVIYVPQYNPATVVVGGYPAWGYYPTAYPSYYYPYAPGAALAAGVIWGAAIGAAWSGNRYGYGGGNNTINVNRNTSIDRSTNINRGDVNRGGAGQGGGSAWKSSKQPGQVSSSVGKSHNTARPGDRGAGGAGSMGGGGARASTQPGGGGLGGGAGARPSTQPAGGGNAFANSGASGRQTQMDSSRGASSRGSAAGGGARPSPSYSGGGGGGGARASGGGGGGARGGGGGGGRGGGGRR